MVARSDGSSDSGFRSFARGCGGKGWGLCVYRVYADLFGTEVLLKLNGEDWMIAIACATILISSLIALSQDNLKRRLAFSTIGQLGYVCEQPWQLNRNGWFRSSHCHACVRKDHPLFLCRCDLRGDREEICQ